MFENPIIREGGHFSFFGTVSALLTLTGVVAVLVYFVFSVEHKGPIRPIARTGIVFLMVAFGAHFGYTVMGRESLLIERIQFLIGNAKGQGAAGEANPHHATIWLLLLVVAAVAVLEFMKARKSEEKPPAQGA